MIDTPTTGLVKSVSIDNMLQVREACATRISSALTLLREARAIAKAGSFDMPRLRTDHRSKLGAGVDLLDDSAAGDLITALDASGWQYLMAESGMRTFMDATARGDWDEKVYQGDVPPFTRDNIASTFSALYTARDDMFERGVLKVFRGLSWNYKTNQPYKFGKRLIVTNLAPDTLRPNSRICDDIDDLVRVMHVLDGKPQPDHRQGAYEMMLACFHKGTTSLTHHYYTLKWFKKGTGHMTFLRLDLVDRMNSILAKHHPNALADEHRAQREPA